MQLENYFDFLAENDIRVKGTRVGIETILHDYLELGLFPEQIAARYPTLDLVHVYAAITYYWQNKEAVESYLAKVEADIAEQRASQERNPSPAIQRLRLLARDKTHHQIPVP